MKRIGILSDTHGTFDEPLRQFFAEVDELWHAGDIGSLELADEIAAFKPLRAVSGNIDGGLKSFGHPVGASGNRIIVTLLHEMKRSGKQYGLASLCIGGGMGTAVILKKL